MARVSSSVALTAASIHVEMQNTSGARIAKIRR